jgi:hypothetical protein
MKITPQPEGFSIASLYLSQTLEENVEAGKIFQSTTGAMYCSPHVTFIDNPESKIARLRFEWGLLVAGLFEYVANDCYYIDYTTTEDHEDKLNSLVLVSYAKYLQAFDERKTKVSYKSLPVFHKSKLDHLRNKIVSIILEKG